VAYIEIKARTYIDATLAQSIIDKQTVIGLVCTGRISGPAKRLLDRAGIAWAEQIPEEDVLNAGSLEGTDA
jgi:hypothetical protein